MCLFAEEVVADLILLELCFVDSQQWKSNLKDAASTVSKLLQPLNCELATDSSPNRCSSWNVTEENVSMLLSARSQNCTVTLDKWGQQLSDAPSISVANLGQNISKHVTEDNACKQSVDLCLKNMVHHEIMIYSNFKFADFSFITHIAGS